LMFCFVYNCKYINIVFCFLFERGNVAYIMFDYCSCVYAFSSFISCLSSMDSWDAFWEDSSTRVCVCV
jgi:hypothetical protein